MFEDLRTQLNTEMNKSVSFSEDILSRTPEKKSRKSKSLNTSTASNNSSILGTPETSIFRLSSSLTPKKGILKTPESINERTGDLIELADAVSRENEDRSNSPTFDVIERPRTLDEWVDKESLTLKNMPCAFNLTDLDEDDELWILDIPKSINPLELKDQELDLSDKSKLKLGGDRYIADPSLKSECVPCVVGTGKDKKPFKVVNLKSNGTIVVRKKLSGSLKKESISGEDENKDKVPFPVNLRSRHPILGVQYARVLKKRKKKKRSRVSVTE